MMESPLMNDWQRWVIWCVAAGVSATLTILFWMYAHILAYIQTFWPLVPGFTILIGIATNLLYAERFLARLIISVQIVYYLTWFILIECNLCDCEFSEQFIGAIAIVIAWHLIIIILLTIAQWQRSKIKWRYGAGPKSEMPSPPS